MNQDSAKIQPYALWDLIIHQMFIFPGIVTKLKKPELDMNQGVLKDDEFMFYIHNGKVWKEAEVGFRRVFPLNGHPYDKEVTPGA